MADPVRRGLLPSCDGAPTAAAWGAVTARQEAAPDRIRRLTNLTLVWPRRIHPSLIRYARTASLRSPLIRLRPQLLWSELTIVRGSVNQRRIL